MLKTVFKHPWNVSTAEARDIQLRLQKRVIRQDQLPEVKYVAGVDVGFEANNTISRAAVAVLSFPELTVQETAIARDKVSFPYISGFLSFREVPVVLKALSKLSSLPDILLCDGQGLAHPRRMGIACHLGVLTDLPTIGVAKSRLIGYHDDVPEEKGSRVLLQDKDEVIGAVLRTRTGVKPLYISTGHKISLPTAMMYVMQCLTKYRLPETTRWAHKLASLPRVF